MLLVLASLAPVYLENYRLQQYMRNLTQGSVSSAVPDEKVRADVLSRAQSLDLPVLPGEIQITHPNGRLRLEIKYAVQMHLGLYQVDLHFHPSAQS